MIAAAQPVSYSVLVATAAILFWIAVNDFRSFKIPNNIILVLVALFCLYVLVSGRWVVLHWHVGFRGGHVPPAVGVLCAKLDGRRRRQTIDGGVSLDRDPLRADLFAD